MLSAALDEALPEGALVAKYRLTVRSTDEAVKVFSNLLQVRADFQLVDVTLCECSRLVAAQCVERAVAVEKVCYKSFLAQRLNERNEQANQASLRYHHRARASLQHSASVLINRMQYRCVQCVP
jgi:hypothetical protein